MRVDHEIQPEQLEVVLPLLLIQKQERAFDGFGGDVLHFGDEVSLQIEIFANRVRSVQVPLELMEGEFVGWLVLAVSARFLLDRIVGEVDVGVSDFREVEGVAGCPDVPLLIPVGLGFPVVDSQQHEHSDVELPMVVEQWVRDVQLQDQGSFLALLLIPISAGHDSLFDVVEVLRAGDALSSIRELPWLHDPTVRQLFLLPVFVEGDELFVLLVENAFADVEGDGHNVEDILVFEFVVLAE